MPSKEVQRNERKILAERRNLDYTAAEAVTNGQVVSLGNRIGVAGNDIAEGATGALHVTGVYIMDKKASEKITMGTPVYYDATADEITATEKGNVPAGYAAATAEASDATVLVNIGNRTAPRRSTTAWP